MNNSPPAASALNFLNGGGNMGMMMRAHDWSASPLGSPSDWPQSLRTVAELLLNSKFPMFVAWGPDLGFLYNDAYAEILGAKHPAALGQRFYDIWSEIWPDISPLIERALQGEATYSERLPLTMNRKGYDEQTWFTFSYSPVRDDRGQVAGMYCACVEVTEQVLAEKYRAEENERFRTLFEQTPSATVIVRGRDHVFELANRAYYQLIGHREVLGKPARDAVPELVAQGFIDLLDKVYATGEPLFGRSIPIKLQREPSGPLEDRFVDFVYQPIRDARGNVTGIFGEANDVTDHKLAEDELRALAADLSQANRRQSEFLATLAHELRNPLAPIRTGLDLMRVNGANPATATRIREMMERQTDHLVHLVNDLLDIARINTGKIELKRARVLLKDVVLHAVETTLPAIEVKHHDFSVQVLDEPIWLDADTNRLSQIIGNILSNASKYTPENGKIALSVRRETDTAIITITDNGIGIPDEELPHIFAMFTQTRDGKGHAHGGLGIGLNLVKRLTEKHGGTVSASSAGPGQGSTFTVRLPITPPNTAGAGDLLGTRDDRPEHAVESLRILIADDNEDAVELLQHLLKINGHTVEVAHDGHAALDKARHFLPDLALLDIGMPGMNGYELAGRLRRLPELRSTRLVALTGWGMESDRDRARAAGFDRHLTKPINMHDLNQVVSEVASASK
ncbi:PAS domain-containing protein [Noviherbaspirillum sp. CPCC 100848]|uniref:histidine kinase n=1 Tax=Noviherbaspirillum album TaxID=3080276 RepID=A0ABU6JIP2_9BURK|nr:ATP-binding protein [Noviherbaspirillum sp. CPCC 100848]MEC4723549.1 PAS domain-containing protein [Noviherbaspirillum sp. CPCC 100848]